MLLAIPDVLSKEQLASFRAALDGATWVDGRATAGHQSARAKHNVQLAEDDPLSVRLGAIVLDALDRNPLFVSAALPRRVFPPLFNRYAEGQSFGVHVDNAIRVVKGAGVRLRTDLSATLFLSDPEEYDGGELSIEGGFGLQQVKLPAGHMVLYPASSLHRVEPVARGARLASFFWIQSMVRDDADRAVLFDLDQSIQRLAPEHPSAIALTGVYHNLLRRWADV
jgi:PKHD-type hydroxylase